MRHCPDRGRRAVLLTLVGITCNMRSGNGSLVHQFKIDVRLVVPRVNDYRSQLGDGLKQGILADHLAPCRIDEESARLHLGKEIPVSHSTGSLIQWNMKRNYL